MKTAKVDFRLLAIALAIKYGAREGAAVIGDETLRWVKKNAKLQVTRDGDLINFIWTSPPLT